MAREDALIFLNDFVDNPLHLLPIIHEPTVRSMIGKLYDDLSRPRGTSPHPAHAALVFSLAATCASFYYDGCNIAHMFHGEDEAGEATLAWVHSALGLLDQSQRATSYCLEDIQARVIIAYVFYNTEGCSARFRFLHSSSLSMARDLGLHLIDGSKNNQSDDRVTKEIKRRLWWYIVSTDW